jgi:hypothetical protein
MSSPGRPSIATVRELAARHSNWGRWGADGADAIANTSVGDFYGGVDRYFRAADDIVIMPLQSGTQWDALSHVMFEERIYNGYSADQVSSAGALRNDVRQGSDAMVGRGVLLDVPRALGVPWLEPGFAIGAEDLDRAAAFGGVEVGRGDFVFVRTGVLAQVRSTGSWGSRRCRSPARSAARSTRWPSSDQEL